ncbi:MAG: hypothetical protein IJC80_04625 [Clostridia bacterium]|nr:hypothetical protein [Clostridia bacterium]
MKKRIALMMTLALMLIFIFLLCSCGKENEQTKIIYIDRNEKYGYCEHRWESQGQTSPTCTKEGANYMKCTICGERKTAKIPTVECEYEESWQWYNNNYSVALILHCKHNSAHNKTVIGHVNYIYGQLIQESTCTEAGKLSYRASAVYQGKTYSTERIETLSRTPHKYETVKTQLSGGCFGGTRTVQKCTECGIEKIYTEKITYEHTDTLIKARYDLTSYGYCGGFIEVLGCECGETTYLNIKPSCENMREQAEKTMEREETGESHVRMTSTCTVCGFNIVNEVGTAKSCKLYSKTTVMLDESTVLSYCEVNEENHDNLGQYHETVITYEGLKASCKDGYFVVFSCTECPYEKKLYTKGHYLINEAVSLDIVACIIEITVEKCHCGYIGDIELEYVDRQETEISPSEHFGESTGLQYLAKAYKCTECGISYYIGNVLEIAEVDGTEVALIYEICSVKKDGDIIYEVKSSNIGHSNAPSLSFTENPVAKERALLDDFNSIKNQAQ